jgi:hypothetical protein
MTNYRTRESIAFDAINGAAARAAELMTANPQLSAIALDLMKGGAAAAGAMAARSDKLCDQLSGQDKNCESQQNMCFERFDSRKDLPAIIGSEIVQKNIDVIANLVSKLPDQMFPLDAKDWPMLKLGGLEKIEKHGSTFSVTTDGARSMPVGERPIDSIEFEKKFSFDLKADPKTGAAKFENIHGVNAKASVYGIEVNLPIHSIQHSKAGDATFAVGSGLPMGLPGEIKADVGIDRQGQIHVDRPRIAANGNEIDLRPFLKPRLSLPELELC